MINLQKLPLHHYVEVRQLEEGLRGSWHPGVVVGVSESCRAVRYDELLCESGSSKLVESIPVTWAIEGLQQRPCVKFNYRGRIRPVPPPSEYIGLKFGVCVDVLYEDAWWEGVIFDCDENAKEHLVYFPDEGDERIYELSDIRVTLEWDELSGSWRERGIWQLVNIARVHQRDGNLCQLIRRAWSLLKVHYGYQKMVTEWTCGAYRVWKDYFREVICDVTAKHTAKSLVFPTDSRRHVPKKRGRRPKTGKHLNVSVRTKSTRKKKDEEVGPAVRTRLMRMSEPENSPVSDAAKGCHVPNFRCGHSHATVEDSCLITDSAKADAREGFDQVASICCVDLSDYDMEERKFCHVGTTLNGILHTKSPCYYSNYSKSPVKNLSRRKWHLMENNLTPKKLTPSRRISHERRTRDGSKMVHKVDNHASKQVSDYNSVDRRVGLMKTQKKVGFTVRYSVLRKGGRITARRSIRKKRSPSRIITISSDTNEEDGNKSTPLLSEISEESKSSHKEDNLLGGQCKIAHPAVDSRHEHLSEDTLDIPDKQKARRRRCLDSVCFICQYGDELLHCDHCMSSYHISCIDSEKATVRGLLCPSCRCGLCGSKDCASKDQLFSNVCYQCSRQYHMACLDRVGITVSEDVRFCSKNCFEICASLHQLLRISNPTSVEGLTWSVTRSRRNDCNVYNERIHPLIQVSKVLNVFHECFQPIREPHTGRDLVADIIYNSGSKFRRLDFHGFYVMALVNADEVVCAATIRIHGQKVAEMPLIATPFKYRRQGMCRLLLRELEKMLAELGVEILVLPGIATLRETWVSSFGFTEMPASARKELLGYPFVLFQGTTLFQKTLRKSLEAPSNAGSFTPRSLEADECPTSSFNKCDVHQIDTIERVVTPITLTYSRKIRLNKELPELKSMIEYKDFSQGSTELDRIQPECSEDNCSKNERRRFSLCYKRRKLHALNEEKTVIDELIKKQPTLKYVYKRRRIQASRSSSDYL